MDLGKEIEALKKRVSELEKRQPSKNSLFGKPQSEIGSTSSDTVISTLGQIKVKYGNKYVTIFKNGKLTNESEQLNFIYKTDQVGTDNGIYVIQQDDKVSIFVVIDKQSFEISSSENTYVSFLTSQDTSSSQKETALTNIGFLYPTMEAFYENGISSGLIYIQGENKLYTVINGVPQVFEVKIPEKFSKLTVDSLVAESIELNNTTLKERGIVIDSGSTFSIGNVIFSNIETQVQKLQCSNIYGNGFSITEDSNGQSTLVIDRIQVTNASIQNVPQYTSYDIITSIMLENGVYQIKTLYNSIYKEHDILLVQFPESISEVKHYLSYDNDGNLLPSYDSEGNRVTWKEDYPLLLLDKNGVEITYVKGDELYEYSSKTLSRVEYRQYIFRKEVDGFSVDSMIEDVTSMFGAFIYLISRRITTLDSESGESKEVDTPIPLVSIKDNVKLVFPTIVGNTVFFQDAYVEIGRDLEEGKSGLLLTHKDSNSLWVKYSEDSNNMPLDVSDKTLVTAEWVKNYIENKQL